MLANDLPSPLTQPQPTLPWMLKGTRAWVAQVVAGRPILLAARSGTWVDVGNWTGARPLLVVVTDEQLHLLAAGRNQVRQSVALADLIGSSYNHVTGQLVLTAGMTRGDTTHGRPRPDEVVFRQVKLQPLVAYQVLSQIQNARVGGRQQTDNRPRPMTPGPESAGPNDSRSVPHPAPA